MEMKKKFCRVVGKKKPYKRGNSSFSGMISPEVVNLRLFHYTFSFSEHLFTNPILTNFCFAQKRRITDFEVLKLPKCSVGYFFLPLVCASVCTSYMYTLRFHSEKEKEEKEKVFFLSLVANFFSFFLWKLS